MKLITKTCRICGQPFQTTNGRQLDCKKQIKKTCEVCGKDFEAECSKSASTVCSKECRYKLSTINRIKSYQKKTVVCALCGKEFHPRSNTQRVCDDEHYRTCVVCGNSFKLDYSPSKGRNDLRITCSKECLSKYQSEHNAFSDPKIRAKIEQTMIDKYGVAHPSQNKELLEKQKATTRERYGVDFFPQSKDYIEKTVKTNKERYGTAWPMQNEDILQKSYDTARAHYGVEHPSVLEDVKQKASETYKERTGYAWPMQNPDTITKSKETSIDKYGVDSYSKTEEYKEQCRATSIERYGTEYPMQNEELKQQVFNTNLEKYGSISYLGSEEGQKRNRERMQELYGVDRYSQTLDWKERVIKVCTNLPEWLKFVEDPATYITNNYEEQPTYRMLSHDLGVKVSTVNDLITRNSLTHLVKRSISYMEEEIAHFLDELGIEYNLHDRNVIKPQELDFYIPSCNIGIECNPTATHNSSIHFKGIDKIEILPYSYHQKKTNKCEEVGVFVFHLFSFDWDNRREILKSMIKNLLNKTENVIYARKCEMKEVPWDESIKFLEENHRQGSANSKVRLGLYYKHELVSLMTFGKMRKTIGIDKTDLENCWELVRFCSKLNTHVVGGASKLFKRFVTEYNPAEVRSFSDRARTRGGLYQTLGFQELRRSEPGYVWVDTATDIAYNRVNAQKHNLKRFLNDDSIDLTKTEAQIMVEHGYVQVFDSGTITWQWKS